MCCISPLYPESPTAISSSFRNETNARRVSVILFLPAQDGPWTQTTSPVAMHTPTLYLSPLPLSLWDMNFSENFISTGMSMPSSVTNALLPILPKYRLSHTIYLWELRGVSWLRGAQYIHVRKKLTTSHSRYNIASTNSSDHFRCVFLSTLPTLWELLCSVS